MQNAIVFDGPAGSGKSTVAKLVATHLGYDYLDTGAIYRSFGLWAKEQLPALSLNAVSELDEAQIADLFTQFQELFQISMDADAPTFRVRDTDMTEAIRTPEASQAASAVAQVPAIREHMVTFFRSLMELSSGIVAEGRDLTTVVAPDATLRIIITADEAVRMARRSNDGVEAEKIIAEIRLRDQHDSKMVNFTEPAPGVHLIDTTLMTIDEVVAEALGLYQAAN